MVLSVVGNSMSAETEQRKRFFNTFRMNTPRNLSRWVSAENGGLISVLTSHKGNTFTIIVTSPEGETCMVAAGEDWQALIWLVTPKT